MEIDKNPDFKSVDQPEPARLRPSKLRDEFNALIREVETRGIPIELDLTGPEAVLRPKPEPTPDEAFNLGLAAIFKDIQTKRSEREQHLTEFPIAKISTGPTRNITALPRVAPWPPPKPSLSDRLHMYREGRRERRYYREPRLGLGLRRAIGAVAAMGLMFGGSFLAASSVPHESAQREATPAVALNVVEAPTTTTTTTVQQSTPQFTQEQAKAIITIASARHEVEVAHPEFSQVQVDTYFMGAMDFAAHVQGASSVQS